MRISEAQSKSREPTIDFDHGAVLYVTYRPISYTLEELDALTAITEAVGGDAQARRSRANRVAEMISRLVISWDLTDENEVVIDPQDIDARYR